VCRQLAAHSPAPKRIPVVSAAQHYGLYKSESARRLKSTRTFESAPEANQAGSGSRRLAGELTAPPGLVGVVAAGGAPLHEIAAARTGGSKTPPAVSVGRECVPGHIGIKIEAYHLP
jgi:hypothetical protein